MDTRYSIPALPIFTKNTAEELFNIIKHENALGKFIHQAEFKEKNSLFICSLSHCDSVESAKLFIETMKSIYADATHNCWAFQVYTPHSTAFIGCSDDGEPQGTAGKPMLNQLIHAPVGEIAAVVTRYFGGTKLGTGGLVRAYQTAVALGLENLPLKEKVIPVLIEITLDYSHADILHRIQQTYEIQILNILRQADVTYSIEIPQDRKESFINFLTAYTNGLVLIKEISS